MAQETETKIQKENGKGLFGRIIKLFITLIVITGGSILGFRIWYFDYRPYITTEDARINADIVKIANLGAGGQIQAVYVKEGESITQGMLLIEMDHSVAQAQYDRAEARSEYTESILHRDQALLDNSGLTKQQFDNARFDYGSAQADLRLAKIALNRTYLKSPAEGIVILKNTVTGNILEAGQTAVMIADIKNAWVSANISEKLIDLVKPGQQVDISIDQFGGIKFKGKVKSIGHAANSIFSLLPTSSGSTFTKVVQEIQVKIDIMDAGINLIPGVNVTVRIHVR